ncbi:MAG: YihY family inner membrane protein [Gammaproteobacteria bacterium]
MNNRLNKLIATLFRLYKFCRLVLRRFIARQGFQSATALAYTTLLSIVPLVGVMFSFFGEFPVFNEINVIVEDFVFANFVPEFGRAVQGYLIEFSLNASRMTRAGIIVLTVIALLMMWGIESAINQAWDVPVSRNPVKRFCIYLVVLTLGPVLLGIGLYSTSYLLALPLVRDVDASLMLRARLLTVLPFLTTTLALTLLYYLVPYRSVNRHHALTGAVFAALCFELAKYYFGIYVKSVPTYEVIYGALAIVPMFLVWIYVSWVIVLLGAQVACCLSDPAWRR